MMLLVKNKQVDVNGLLYFMLIKFSLSIPRGGGVGGGGGWGLAREEGKEL